MVISCLIICCIQNYTNTSQRVLKYCLSRRRICGRNVTTAMLYALPCRLKLMIYYLQLRLCKESQIRRRRKARTTPRKRSQEEQKIIDTAKHMLMEKNNMTEQEAFRYIQKCSMDSGNTMVESATMVMSIFTDA